MKKIICLLLSALLVSCSQVSNPTVIVPETNKTVDNTKKDNIAKDVVVNNTTKPDVKVEVKESIKPIIATNSGIKDSVNYVLTGVDKALENLPSPTPSPTSNPTPVVTPSPTPIPDPRANDPRYTTSPSGVSIYVPTPAPTKVPYRVDYPIVEYGNLSYNLIFKDEYKVRYDKENKLFYSLLGHDLKSVNDIFIKDNINISPSSDGNEQINDLVEKRLQDSGSYIDYPNPGSEYYLFGNNINIKEFVLKGRENTFVRQFNVYESKPTINTTN